jgi:AcrR family transcriptional regulator
MFRKCQALLYGKLVYMRERGFMGENQERRQAHRQKRGAMRVEEIIAAASVLFAELGYDKVTTNMIAARAGISPGSLYQFFPNKEAIAQAFAAEAVTQLALVYDTMSSFEMTSLPLREFLDTFIERIIAFNRNYPGYLALELASTISPTLAHVLAHFQHEIQARFDQMMATRWPGSSSEQRRIPELISYRLFLALLPLILQNDEQNQTAIVQEMKTMLYRYWEALVAGRDDALE